MHWFIFICLMVSLQGFIFGEGLSIPDRMTHEKKCFAGETYKEVIPLKNESTEVIKVKITHVDYRYNSQGENFFEKIRTNPFSNGEWIKFSPSLVEIPPKQKTYITCTINVPKYPDLKGTYWSMLLIEQEPLRHSDLDGNKPCLGINTKVRYGFLLVSHLGGEQKSEIKIIRKSLQGKKLVCEYENCGKWLAKPKISYKVFSPEGKELKDFMVGSKKLYPNCSSKVEFDLSSLPSGVYQSLLLFDQKGSLTGAEYELTLR